MELNMPTSGDTPRSIIPVAPLMPQWRCSVLHVPQDIPQMPGTPIGLLQVTKLTKATSITLAFTRVSACTSAYLAAAAPPRHLSLTLLQCCNRFHALASVRTNPHFAVLLLVESAMNPTILLTPLFQHLSTAGGGPLRGSGRRHSSRVEKERAVCGGAGGQGPAGGSVLHGGAGPRRARPAMGRA